LRLLWTDAALAQLEALADRAPAQAAAVVRAMEWMAARDMGDLGRRVPGRRRRYWPVPPQGVYYSAERGQLIVYEVRDARRRRNPFW
jgi:plasmid stabilization system protein ParE